MLQIIWKRPDGFQNAAPQDFRRLPLSNGAQLWLHRTDRDWYPFLVCGDWSQEADTVKLNRLIYLLDASDADWEYHLNTLLRDQEDHRKTMTMQTVAEDCILWVESISKKIKGDTWEQEIVQCALGDLVKKLKKIVAVSGIR